MSKKNPYVIMGQAVYGSSAKGFSVEVKQYKSTMNEAYRPDAQEMLDELQSDVERLRRVSKVRAYKLNSKLIENIS